MQYVFCQRNFAAKQLTFGPVAETEPNISPDGHWIAFQYIDAQRPASPNIWVLETAKEFQLAKALFAQPRYAGEMSWSPDSRWIAFISSDSKAGRSTEQIFKINISSGQIVQITSFPEGTVIGDATTWSKTGLIAFERQGKIFATTDTGSREVELLDPRIALSNRRPSSITFSPDAEKLLFSVENEQQNQSEVWLADLPTQIVRKLTSHHFDVFPRWTDQGHLLFSRETKDGCAEIHVLSLNTGKLKRITSGHVDFTPSTDPSARTLFFSRKDKMESQPEKTEWLAGFHIWYVPNARWMLE
jgi:Tol biopolymer transport system component